ncbi:hypothetical protein R80B4_00107 [Fibrobacteres bacterium R8-0-B4]
MRAVSAASVEMRRASAAAEARLSSIIPIILETTVGSVGRSPTLWATFFMRSVSILLGLASASVLFIVSIAPTLPSL